MQQLKKMTSNIITSICGDFRDIVNRKRKRTYYNKINYILIFLTHLIEDRRMPVTKISKTKINEISHS